MFGLGKQRTSFGKMLDNNGIKQGDLAKKSGVGKNIISRMCNEDDYMPKIETEVKIKKALKKNQF